MISEEKIIDTINLATDKFKELNAELEVAVILLNDYYKRVKKAIETINLMIYKGYTISNKGTSRSYMATSENSEFGVRAKELLDILKGSDTND